MIKIHTLLDGARTLGEVTQSSGLDLGEVVADHSGPGAGRAGRASGTSSSHSILVIEDDPETVRLIRERLGRRRGELPTENRPRPNRHPSSVPRRQTFQLVILAMDRSEQEAFFRSPQATKHERDSVHRNPEHRRRERAGQARCHGTRRRDSPPRQRNKPHCHRQSLITKINIQLIYILIYLQCGPVRGADRWSRQR